MKKPMYHPLPNGQFFNEDLLSIMINLSKKSKELFNELRNVNLELNIVTLADIDKLSKNEQASLNKSLRQLKKINLFRKVIPFELYNSELNKVTHLPEKYTYMINPHLLKPWKFSLATQIWDLINPITQKE